MFKSDLVYKIRGIIFDIYNHVVGVWDEQTYENILFDVLIYQGYQVARQKEFEVFYKGCRVGLFRPDLIVEDQLVIELKVTPETTALHQAQIISYLKVTGLPLGLLVNFGGEKLWVKCYPNKNYKNADLQELNASNNFNHSFTKVMDTHFDLDKVNLSDKDKELICPYLMMGKEILEILGPGYFHHVYRRAFWEELKMNQIGFEWISQLVLSYNDRVYGQKEVRFFKIGKLLISVVAVKTLDDLALKRFAGLVKHYQCQSGLLVNCNNTIVDFRYIKQ